MIQSHRRWISRFFRVGITTACLLLPGAFSPSLKSLADETYRTGTLIGSWQRDEKGWWFLRNYNPVYPSSQWGDQNGNLYYFDAEGYMVTGWQYIDYHWYYFNPDEGKNQGALIKGWIHDEADGGWYYTNENGMMVTGWHKIGGYWYYFNPVSDGHMGLMAADTVIDQNYVDSNGRMNELQ